MVPGEGRDVGANAVLERGGAQIRLPLPHGDAGVRLAGIDREVPTALREPDEGTDVALLEAARPHHVLASVGELLQAEGQLAPPQDVRRMEEPLDVILEPEDRRALRRAVTPDSLER